MAPLLVCIGTKLHGHMNPRQQRRNLLPNYCCILAATGAGEALHGSL
jgi:hypothetical protein